MVSLLPCSCTTAAVHEVSCLRCTHCVNHTSVPSWVSLSCCHAAEELEVLQTLLRTVKLPCTTPPCSADLRWGPCRSAGCGRSHPAPDGTWPQTVQWPCSCSLTDLRQLPSSEQSWAMANEPPAWPAQEAAAVKALQAGGLHSEPEQTASVAPIQIKESSGRW